MPDFRIETYRILDVTKASEYQALSDNDKALYNLFISAGTVNLEENSIVQKKLWNMFGENTETGQRLRDPLNLFVLIPQQPEEE